MFYYFVIIRRHKKTPSDDINRSRRFIEIEEVIQQSTPFSSRKISGGPRLAVDLAGFSTGRPTLHLSIVGPVAVASKGQFPPPLSIRSNLIRMFFIYNTYAVLCQGVKETKQIVPRSYYINS